MVRDVMSWPWGIMAPEFVIVGTIILLSLIDLFLPKRTNRAFIPFLGIVGIALSTYFVFQSLGNEVEQIMYDMYRVDGFANIFKLISLIGTGLVFILSLQTLDRKEIDTNYRGEYYTLLLTALLGAMMMASSADLITLFVSIELLSISSYILVGLRKKHIQSNESAFKYVVSGGISTAIFLFGMSYLYGITGSTNLFEISYGLQDAMDKGFAFIIFIAFFFILVGLAFKIAAAPFHMWAPDVYQGAPTSITAFLSVVSKVAGFAMISRIFFTSFAGLYNETLGIHDEPFFIYQVSIFIAIVAAATMIIGNTVALRQTNIKRMMAYSSIAQAGYILVPLAEFNQLSLHQMIFYLIAYLLMNLGAFAIITVVTKDQDSDDLRSFAGLYHRAPFTAIAMSIFIISLAGIPISAGFFGKFYIFFGTIVNENYWLAGVMIATSVVSYFYYFGIIRQMYMRTGTTEARLKLPVSILIVVLVGLIGTVGGGLFPGQVLDFIQNNFFADLFFQMFN